MADSSGQDKTEEPTAKRLKESREKGQVARSRELNTMVSLFFASLGFVMVGDFMASELVQLFQRDLSLERDWLFDTNKIIEMLSINTTAALKLLAPFFLFMFISVFVGPLLVGGWNFAGKSLQPKFSKLNPFTGIKRVFGPNGLVELLKALAKFILIGAAAIVLAIALRDELAGLGQESIEQGLIHGAQLFFLEFFVLTAMLVVIAIFDVPYQLWNNRKKQRMTRQEVKQENKQTEGNPEVKGRIRALQREVAQRKMLQDVPEANVIIVNPTHFAVALKYEDGKSGAPKVVARGVDHIALKIREIGAAHHVPVFTAPPLARALYYSSEIGQTIPEGLYIAVAKILAYVFQLKNLPGHQAQAPTEFEVPKEFTNLSSKNTQFER